MPYKRKVFNLFSIIQTHFSGIRRLKYCLDLNLIASFHFLHFTLGLAEMRVDCGMDWLIGRALDPRPTGCEFESHYCFNSLTALGKLLTTNVCAPSRPSK